MYPLLSFGVLALGAALFVVAQKFVKDNVVFRNCVRAAGVLLAAVGVWALAMLLSAARSFRWAESAPKGKGHSRAAPAGRRRHGQGKCAAVRKSGLRHLEGQGRHALPKGRPKSSGGRARAHIFLRKHTPRHGKSARLLPRPCEMESQCTEGLRPRRGRAWLCETRGLRTAGGPCLWAGGALRGKGPAYSG